MSSSYITLMNELGKHRNANELTDRYYEGTRTTRPGFSIPPTIRRDVMNLVCGWPATTVDVLHERIDWRGWDTDAKYMKILQDVYEENELAYESELGHLDSLMYGMSFGVVGTGDKKIGEPEILATVESAKDMTGYYNRRKRRIEIPEYLLCGAELYRCQKYPDLLLRSAMIFVSPIAHKPAAISSGLSSAESLMMPPRFFSQLDGFRATFDLVTLAVMRRSIPSALSHDPYMFTPEASLTYCSIRVTQLAPYRLVISARTSGCRSVCSIARMASAV